MLHSGDYLWNAGIFLFKADDMIRAFCSHAPEILELTSSALNSGKPDLGFFRLNPEAWNKLTSISIDYAIMEKIDNLISIPFSSKWSDLGSWDSVWLESNKDQFGVAQSISAHAIDCRNTILRSEDKAVQLVGLGLDNIIAVAMPDAVLVASKERAQDVKSVVEYLKRIEIEQAEIFPKEYRPWGWFECLAMEDNFQVKRICVEPGAALSLQSHQYRSEHWVLVEGIAKVSIDDEVRIIGKGESVYVPLGAIHRLENPGDVQTILIEIQVGTYFGEDDIVRYSDAYGRK
jgi:mannose-1-phosphate guanylyltransferase/mannose-6-phosphate isomerase